MLINAIVLQEAKDSSEIENIIATQDELYKALTINKTSVSADAVFDQFDTKKSNTILESMLLIDTLQNEQKCEVLRQLAHQDWKYYKNYDLAKKRLMKADSIGASKFDLRMIISRIEIESLNFGNSLNTAIEAEKLTKSENEINLAKIEFAQTVYELSVDPFFLSQQK